MEINVLDKQKIISELKEIHEKLVAIYSQVFDYKFKSNKEFSNYIEDQYKANSVGKKEQEAWNAKFCHRASYTLLNKILFVRICEDKGFMRNQEDYIAGEIENPHIGEKLSKIGLQKWASIITNYTFGELIKFAFQDMKESYSNIVLYKDDKYEILNPTDEELNLNYLDGNKDTKNIVFKFEKIISDIIEKLDTEIFNFEKVEGSILGDVYEQFMDRETRKAIGQFYTPEFVIDYILKNTVAEADIVKNPFVTVVDISCGSGHFLIMAYDILREKFTNNLEKLREQYCDEIYKIKINGREKEVSGREYWIKENIHYHLLKHCIHGSDIDSFAVQLTTINLLLKDLDNFTDELNIIECDSLIKWEIDYDWKDLKKQLIEDYEIITTSQINLFGEEEKITIKQKKEKYKLKYKDLLGIETIEEVTREKALQIIMICEFWNIKFNYIVGNPPYVGHKQLTTQYKEWLLKEYSNVFKDKSDLSFCFFQRIFNLISNDGMVAIITSRYFMENPTGEQLRTHLNKNVNILQIVDFYGAEIFKGAGVATAIYFGKIKETNSNKIKINKLTDDKHQFNDNDDLNKLIRSELFERFLINQEDLDVNRWILIPESSYRIYAKIENRSKYKLSDIAMSFQGIITGCDRAFVLDDKEIIENKIERNLLKKWIKNSNVYKYGISESTLSLIYSDMIIDEMDYPNSISFIKQYVDRLENRRECKNGLRKWYQLQWGRYKTLFEQPKIVFPYKAKSNRFAIDYNNYYCSADVYSLIIKDNYENKISLKYLVGLLNSSIYEFYFKLFAKKMGRGIYDYYPNSIMDLAIPIDTINNDIEERVDEIINISSQMTEFDISKFINANNLVGKFIEFKTQHNNMENRIKILEGEINKIIGEYLGLEDDEYRFINDSLSESTGVEVEAINQYLINLDELDELIASFIRKQIEKGFKSKLEQLSIDEIQRYFREENIELINIIKSFQHKRLILNTKDSIEYSMSSETMTWNAYIKARKTKKINKIFVKYSDNEHYGLLEWEDDIHIKYFINSIKRYTTKEPNIDKAKDTYESFKDLNIANKDDYMEVISIYMEKIQL